MHATGTLGRPRAASGVMACEKKERVCRLVCVDVVCTTLYGVHPVLDSWFFYIHVL